MTLAYCHCKTLAAMSEEVLAVALDVVRERHCEAHPGLASLRVQKQRVVEEHGHYLWLHIAVVFTDEAAATMEPGDLEVTHWQLARDIQRLAMLWGHCWPVLHCHREGAVPVGYVKPRPGIVLPDPPPPIPIYVAKVKRREADEEPETTAADAPATPAPKPAAPSTQGGFGFL